MFSHAHSAGHPLDFFDIHALFCQCADHSVSALTLFLLPSLYAFLTRTGEYHHSF
jgi:hypothetical protein